MVFIANYSDAGPEPPLLTVSMGGSGWYTHSVTEHIMFLDVQNFTILHRAKGHNPSLSFQFTDTVWVVLTMTDVCTTLAETLHTPRIDPTIPPLLFQSDRLFNQYTATCQLGDPACCVGCNQETRLGSSPSP